MFNNERLILLFNRFVACCHFKIYHITNSDYDDFVSVLLAARAAFQLTPGGHVQFLELVAALKRSKSFKKDLSVLVSAAIQSPMTGPPTSQSSSNPIL